MICFKKGENKMQLKQKNVDRIKDKMFEWGFDIYESNRNNWTDKDYIEFEAMWLTLRKLVHLAKEKA